MGLSIWVGVCASCRGTEREGYVQIVGDAYVIFHAPHALIRLAVDGCGREPQCRARIKWQWHRGRGFGGVKDVIERVTCEARAED